MKQWMIIGLVLAMTTLTGCVANWAGVHTIEEIKRSADRAEHISAKDLEAVTKCLVTTLHHYQTESGRQPYADVTLQVFGTTQAIMLRKQANLVMQASTLQELGELLFLIENTPRDTGGTRTTVWVNQMLLMSKRYLANLDAVVQTCS